MVTVPSKVQNASHFLHSVTVGSGGNSSASGSNSVFDSITAYGGGRGGGNGATNANRTGSAGTNGLGGGGGGAAGYYPGANYYGGTGGSGVVIIRYPTGTVTASGGTISTTTTDTIHTFTSDDTFTVTSTSYFATSSAPTRFVDFTYEYDPVGNITSSTDNATGANNQTTAYTYDALNRLLSASTTGISTFAPYSRSYTYNALGNITSVASPTVTTHTYAGTGYANPHAPTTIGGVVLRTRPTF